MIATGVSPWTLSQDHDQAPAGGDRVQGTLGGLRAFRPRCRIRANLERDLLDMTGVSHEEGQRMRSDAELYAAAMAGGSEAFAPIVERYADAVFGVALSRLGNFHDAQDVAQQAFVARWTQGLRAPRRVAQVHCHPPFDRLPAWPAARFGGP